MRLQQGQIWKRSDDYLRIVQLERLEVKYKCLQSLTDTVGPHHHVTKKEFCRLLKQATLMTPDEVRQAMWAAPAGPDVSPAGPKPAP